MPSPDGGPSPRWRPWPAGAIVAVAVGDACLCLCASPATSARAADDKARFLAIMVGWAWPRDPALGAVLNAARQAESDDWDLG